MGYDVARFVGEIDGEFHCLICSMIFKNPVETPCGHGFCYKCIATWLSNNRTCPIDHMPLSQYDLKTPGRLFRNLLNKSKINCDFESEGCNVIVELGHLQHHLTICTFTPNSEITCDKGCKRKIRRCDHQTHNCLKHLSNLIGELWNENNISEWTIDDHLLFSKESNILQSESKWGHGQSNYSLRPDRSSFLVEVLNIPLDASIYIGLAPKDRLSKIDSIYCDDVGYIYYRECSTYTSRLVVGDFIECGMKYPQNFSENQSKDVVVYFSKNGDLIFEYLQVLTAPLFPTIALSNPGSKVKLHYNVPIKSI